MYNAIPPQSLKLFGETCPKRVASERLNYFFVCAGVKSSPDLSDYEEVLVHPSDVKWHLAEWGRPSSPLHINDEAAMKENN